jgi:hypothetical protein
MYIVLIAVSCILAGFAIGWAVFGPKKDRSPVDDRTLEAIDLVLAERVRQVEELGITTGRDDRYLKDELAMMAACYLYAPRYPFAIATGEKTPNQWPHSTGWNPRTSRLRQLEKAGALVIAEIERILRKNKTIPITKNPGNYGSGTGKRHPGYPR